MKLLNIIKYKFSQFKQHFSDLRVITANLIVLIKTTFLGVVFAETTYFANYISTQMNNAFLDFGHEWQIVIWGTIAFFSTIVYLMARGIITDIKKLFLSYRVDVLVAFCFGLWLSIACGGFLSVWYEELAFIFSLQQLMIIVLAPFIFATLVIGRSIFWKRKQADSSFLVDKELEETESDLLNFTEKANRFAGRIFNNGASDSFVFGLDAPWGIGKSSFINFCKKYWEKHHTNETVIYKFNPLQYAGSDNLLGVFVDGLINAIQKDAFIPEVKPLISRYSRLLREASQFSIFGFTLPTFTVSYTVDEAFDDLTAVLGRFHKKVIIIVDDLDRMNFSEIKDILFVVRKSFVLPNISYVLCYDTENIGILEAETPDTEKVSEFLEKFVNIKISLFLDKEDLANYVSDNLDKVISTKLVDPILVRQAIGGLLDIYKSSGYHNYLPFIGDVRKLKRLINTVVLFELESTDFKNSDFDKQDLIHLLLIYIHFPNVFRKIYDSETNGSRGFFSLVVPYDDGYPNDESGKKGGSFSENEYKNSTYYKDYIALLSEAPRQRFLLNKVFDVNVRLGGTLDFPIRDSYAKIDSIPENIRTSYACFNGGWTNGRNLETYLNLIVKLSKPENIAQHKFYENWKDEIANGVKVIEDALADPKFAFNKGEFTREKLWRILVNNARSLKSEVSNALITHILNNIHDYSSIEIQDISIGLRKNVDYFITRLLNDAGWQDASGGHSNNTPENIKEITEWVFGEGRHEGNGVLEKLSQTERGVLGLYDLLAFRLYCSADRGGDIFDLSRALAQHANPKAPTDGNTQLLAKEEMREISQKVFHIFKTQYIGAKKNIFEEISELSLEQLAGQYKEYFESQVQAGKLSDADLDNKIQTQKGIIAGFTIFQLGNDQINSGVGCGFYDPTGKEDKQLIRQEMNNYLFNFCFNPEVSTDNIEYFLDYLLRNFASVFATTREDRRSYIASIDTFTSVLDKAKLVIYWQKHSAVIKALNLDQRDKTIYAGNYTASYKEDLTSALHTEDDEKFSLVFCV